MPTIRERELLMDDAVPRRTGFTPRPIEKLAVRRKPHGILDVEFNHHLRTSREEATNGIPPLSYQLWREAGKREAPVPDNADEQYNSNVWRNFRRSYGFHVDSDGQKISEMIANMYPLNIPAPSKVGDYTFEKFLREVSLIRDEKLRSLAIERTVRDTAEFKRLRVRSESRSPPIDTKGNILPPRNFKHLAARFVPPTTPSPAPPPTSVPTQVDMFGRTVPRARPAEPHMWKLTYKLNSPQYKRVQSEIAERRGRVGKGRAEGQVEGVGVAGKA